MRNTLETVGMVILIIALQVALITMALKIVDRMEVRDCYKWQNYEKLYTLYETNPDTAQRCIMLGIDVHEDY